MEKAGAADPQSFPAEFAQVDGDETVYKVFAAA